MKIYTVAAVTEPRIKEDIFTNLQDAENEAEIRSLKTNERVYIYVYSKDSAFYGMKRLWYDGFEIFENGKCVRA